MQYICVLWIRFFFELETAWGRFTKTSTMINRWTRIDGIYWVVLKNHSIEFVPANALLDWILENPGCNLHSRKEMLKLMKKDDVIDDGKEICNSKSIIFVIDYSIFKNSKASWTNYRYLGGCSVPEEGPIVSSFPFPPFDEAQTQESRIVLFKDLDNLQLYRVAEDQIPECLDENELLHQWLISENCVCSNKTLSIKERIEPFLGPTNTLFEGQPPFMVQLIFHIVTKQFLESMYSRDFSVQVLEPVAENLYFLKTHRGDEIEAIPLNFDYLESTLISIE